MLVAAAVILIPEMLSGPKGRDAEVPPADRPAGDAGIKTYTIDLGRSARSGGDENTKPESAQAVESPAPPPEAEVATVTATPPRKAVEAPAAGQAPDKAPAVNSPPQEATPKPSPEPTAASRTAGKQSQPWAVQVGSFANQATAEKLLQDLKRRGYDGFIVPFKTGAQTLYRVRVGPMQDRKDADATMQKLKREGTAATVVAST